MACRLEARVGRRFDASLKASEQYGEVSAAEQERLRMQASYVERPYGWQYNEVIGWVRLRWDGPGPVLKGYAWEVGEPGEGMGWKPRRSFRRGFTPFPFGGGDPIHKVLEIWFEMETDDQIYDGIRRALLGLTDRGEHFHRRHLDLSIFDVVGPQIRWRELMGLR